MKLGHFKDSDAQPELKLDETGKAYLLGTVRWSKFIAIVYFVFVLILILVGVSMGKSIEAAMIAQGTAIPGMGNIMTVFYLIIAIVQIYPLYALYMFSIKMKQAITNINQQTLNTALKYQRGMFKYLGIITLIIIFIYAIVFIFAIAVGIGAGLGAS